MGTLTPDEEAAHAMQPTWKALLAVQAFHAAMTKFLLEELPPELKGFDAPSLSAANVLCCEFRQIWPHYIPDRWELVLADRAGRLKEKIAELNAPWLV